MAPENIYTYISKTCFSGLGVEEHAKCTFTLLTYQNVGKHRIERNTFSADPQRPYWHCKSQSLGRLQGFLNGAEKRRRPRTRQRRPTGNQNICSEINAV